MHHSTLIIFTLMGKLERKIYETSQGKLTSCLPVLADLLNILEDTGDVRILIFVPHCLAEEKELANLLDIIERIRERVRTAVRFSKVEGTPINKIFKRKMGKPLMSIIRVIPIECMGYHKIGRRQVVFEGNMLWISLRETLEILDELKELTPPYKILLDLTGAGPYQLPALESAMIVSSVAPEVSTKLEYWSNEIPVTKWEGSLSGVEDLFLVEKLVRGSFKGELGDLIGLLRSIASYLEGSKLGPKLMDEMIFLLGAICGIKAPLLPLAHLSILEIVSSNLPKISDPGDLKVKVKVIKLEKWIVRYFYEASGNEVNPVEAFILMILSLAREKLNDLGLIPSKDEFEFKIPGIKKVRLVRMSWDWIEAVMDLMDEVHAIPQLVTLCIQFDGLIDSCSDLLNGIKVENLNYNDLAARASEEKPFVVMDEYLKGLRDQKLTGEIHKRYNSIIEDPSLIVENLEELRAHAGLLPPMVYLAYKHERGIDLIYIREIVEELLNLDALKKICGRPNILEII